MNFGGLPPEFCQPDSRIWILPVPYDATSTWGKGADQGPHFIIEASAHMELYDIETKSEVYRRGIFTERPTSSFRSPEEMVAGVKAKVGEAIDLGKFPVTLGGEHSVSIGAIQACAQRFPDLSVLQLDAHSDLRDSYEGSRCSHACVMARARELCPIVQVGIRSMDVSELEILDESRVFFAQDIHDSDSWMDRAVGLLSERVYLTVDLDVFDPSIMPSTGTPEPGGLHWYPVLRFLKKVIDAKHLVAFDVMEMCPSEQKAPNFLAAKLVYTVLSYCFCRNRIC